MTASRRINRIRLYVVALLLIALFGQSYVPYSPSPVHAADSVVQFLGSAPTTPDHQLQAIVDEVVGGQRGTWGIAIKKLDTGQYAAFKGDTKQVSASLYKLWVLCELYRQVQAGIVSLDDRTTVSSEDAYYDSVAGDVRVTAGASITLRNAANLMIHVSDNTSAAVLVRTLGPDNINSFMRKNGLLDSNLEWTGDGDNLTTPLDILHVLEMMATSKMVDAQSSKQMIDTMLGQEINNLLPTTLPEDTQVAHKTGSLFVLRHDAGIVYGPTGPYIIVAMASNLDTNGIAYEVIPELSRRVYKYFASRPTSPVLYFPETRQSVGHDFLKFWFANGGLQTFGYPISPEQIHKGVLVQEFERARFEFHPENFNEESLYSGVSLGLVGVERAKQLALTWQRSDDPGKGKYFASTGQALTGDFYDFWVNNAGERLFGYPLSPATNMVSPTNGKTYLTQWFERARMELHPELPAGQRIVLGTLGSELGSTR